jgi:hypothetical protein
MKVNKYSWFALVADFTFWAKVGFCGIGIVKFAPSLLGFEHVNE